jgi:hypothetical protein
MDAPTAPECRLSRDGDPAKPAVLNKLEQSTTPCTTASDDELAAVAEVAWKEVEAAAMTTTVDSNEKLR